MATMQVSRQAAKVTRMHEAPRASSPGFEADEVSGTGVLSFRERMAKRLGSQYMLKVLDQRARVRRELASVPERMQKITNQATLVLDLIDDVRAKRYRAVPWVSLAVAGAALLYAVSPSDVVPDFVPGLGALDDVVVISLAMRFIRKDLADYVAFKGYDPGKYF